MDQEKADHLDSIVDRLMNLSTTERTTALTHLYNLRTAAVEDLSDLSGNREHWDIVLDSPTQPDNVRTLVRDLTQLADDELARVGLQVSERSSIAQERVLQTAADEERAELQAQLAASAKQARESYIAVRQGLDMKHKAKLAEKMKDVRDAIDQGINTGRDVTTLEEIFDRIEQEFWGCSPKSSSEPRVKTEEQ